MPRLIELNTDLVLDGKVVAKKDTPYIVGIDEANLVKNRYSSFVKIIEPYQVVQPEKSYKDTKRMLIHRIGGIGDILFTFPYLDAIKEENPEIIIDYAVSDRNIAILSISKAVNNFVVGFIPIEELNKFDKILFLEHFIESNPKAYTTNCYDLGKDFFNIERTKDFRSLLLPLKKRKKKDDKKIHLSLLYSSSVLMRNINPAWWYHFLTKLDPKKYRVSIYVTTNLFNEAKETAQQAKSINQELDISIIHNPDLRVIINRFLQVDIPDIVIGPDSGFLNLAGYHQIPLVGIFGPIESQLRLKYYKNAIGLDPINECYFKQSETGSCFAHRTANCQLAEIRNEMFSPCMHKIPPSMAWEAVEFLSKLY